MVRRNAILAAVFLLQLVWLGARAFQSPPSPGSAARGLLLAELVPAEVLRLEIGSGSDSEQWVVVEREEEASAWSVPELFDYAADGDKVDEALRDLAGLEIARVVSSTAHHHVDFKVAESEFEKRIRLEAGGETVELLFGSTGPAGTIHVRRAGEDAVFAVRGYSSWRFGESAKDWIDKVYFTAPRDRIAHVTITVANDQAKETASFSLERAGEESWVLLGAGGTRSPAESDKVDSVLRAMSRVSLSELVGRIDDEDVAFGDPVAVIRLGLVAPPAALETGDAGQPGELDEADDLDNPDAELDAGETGEADTPPVEIEETLTLRVALAPEASDRYWLHADGSEFVAEVARWTVRELLDAVVEDFQAPAEETPEVVETEEPDDSDETEDTREDDAGSDDGESRQDEDGEAS
jgi:hypothetical protein